MAAGVERLIARGDEHLEIGDVAAARLFYRSASEQGSGAAARLLGLTHDPLYFARGKVLGMRPDPEAAVRWYARAIELGDAGAQTRLKDLEDWLADRADRGDAEARRILERRE